MISNPGHNSSELPDMKGSDLGAFFCPRKSIAPRRAVWRRSDVLGQQPLEWNAGDDQGGSPEAIQSYRGRAFHVTGCRREPRRERWSALCWSDRISHFGALLLGYYNPDGRFSYAGRVGTGIDNAELERLRGGYSCSP
jgi:hypothetical protein